MLTLKSAATFCFYYIFGIQTKIPESNFPDVWSSWCFIKNILKANEKRIECSLTDRRFMSAKEGQERIEKYKDKLKKELAAVEEHLEQLKGE